MERLKYWFVEQGLDAKQDIPKAIVIHEVLGAGKVSPHTPSCYGFATHRSSDNFLSLQGWHWVRLVASSVKNLQVPRPILLTTAVSCSGMECVLCNPTLDNFLQASK